MSTSATSSFSIGNGSTSFGGDGPAMGRLPSASVSPTTYSYTLAREVDPYHPAKSIVGREEQNMMSVCAMPQYKTTSPEELRLAWYIHKGPQHSRDTMDLGGVHLNGPAVRDWERQLSVLQDDIPDRSPAMSTASLSTLRAPSPALTTSSGSTIKASSFPRDGRVTPAASDFGTPVLTSTAAFVSSQTPSSSRGKEREREEAQAPVKSFAALSLRTGEPSTPANNVTGGLWGRPAASSSNSDSSMIPPSPAAERYPSIDRAEREWEAAIHDARQKKALLAQARAAYDLAVSLEKAKFKAYSEARLKFDT
ncbi:hypothetical protein FRC00_002556 [Tulasnella sp. 408]|nr:hypothetical protein FRC00_002556 [Tulasnella sp. 408]